MSIRILTINNWERFCSFILKLDGQVSYYDTIGQRRDLKDLAKNLLDTGLAKGMRTPEGLEIIAEKPDDTMALFRYMVNDGRTADFSPRKIA